MSNDSQRESKPGQGGTGADSGNSSPDDEKTSQVDLAKVQSAARQAAAKPGKNKAAEDEGSDATGAFDINDLQSLLDESTPDDFLTSEFDVQDVNAEASSLPQHEDKTGMFDSQELARAMANSSDENKSSDSTAIFDVSDIAAEAADPLPSDTQKLDVSAVIAEDAEQKPNSEATMQVGLDALKSMASSSKGARTTEQVDRKKVLEHMRESGSQVDPELLELFSEEELEVAGIRARPDLESAEVEVIQELDLTEVIELEDDEMVELTQDEKDASDTQRVSSSLIHDAIAEVDGPPQTESVSSADVEAAAATESGPQKPVPRSGSVPSLWRDGSEDGRSGDRNVLRFTTDAAAELARFALPTFSSRLATELVGELAVEDTRTRATYCHALAQALRSSSDDDAVQLAHEFDFDAVELDPTLLPAHVLLIVDAFAAERWDEAVDLLGRFATQLEEQSQQSPVLASQLAPLYTQLELLLEHRLERRLEGLSSLSAHLLVVGQDRLAAVLNAARFALRAGDPSAVTAAYEALVSCSPVGLAESWAIDLVVYLWRDREDTAHASEVARLFLQNLPFSDRVHLAALQLFAWEIQDRHLENEVTRHWIRELTAVHDRLGRSDTSRRQQTLGRIAALHHRGALNHEAAGEFDQARESIHHATTVVGNSLLYWMAAERLAADAEQGIKALQQQLPLLTHPHRIAATHLKIADLAAAAGADDRVDDALVAALSALPTFAPAIDALGRRMLRRERYADYATLLEGAAGEGKDGVGPLLLAEIQEQLVGNPEAAFEHYLRALNEAPGAAPMRGTERTGLLTGQYDRLVEAYLHTAALEETSRSLQKDLSWKATQIITRVIGSPEESLDALRSFATLAPNHIPNLVTLAAHLTRAGEYEEAIGVWKRIADAATDPVEQQIALESRANLASLMLEDAEKVAAIVDELVTSCPESKAAWSIRRQALLSAGNLTGIIELNREQASHVDTPRALLLEAAWLARKSGDLELAATLLETAAEDWRPLVDLQHEVLRQREEWEQLANLVRMTADQNTSADEKASLYEFAGSVLLDRLDQQDAAAELYGSALTAHDGEFPAARELCDMSWASGSWETHLGNLDARIGRDPSALTRWILVRERGFVGGTLLSDVAIAEESYLALLEEENDLFALRGLARLYEAAEDRQSLLEVYHRMAGIIDDPADQLYILTRQGDLMEELSGELSLEWLSAFIDFAPEHPLVQLSIVRAENSVDDNEARQLVELVKRLPDSDSPILRATNLERIAQLHIRAGQLTLARDLLEVAWDTWPGLVSTLIAEIHVNDMLGDQGRAADACARLAEALPGGAYQVSVLHAALVRARAAGDMALADQLKSVLAELEEHYPDPPDFNLEDLEQLKEIYSELELGSTSEPAAGAIQAELARLEEIRAGGRCDEALGFWRTAARLAPGIPQIRAALVLYSHDAELDAETRLELRDYLGGLCTAGEQVELWLAHAAMEARQGRDQEARDAIERVLLIAPGERRALHLLANRSFAAGNVEEAAQWLSRLAHSTTHRPLRAVLECEVALLLDAVLGQPDEAVIHYENALAAQPADASVLHFAARAAMANGAWNDAARFRIQEAEIHDRGAEYRALLYQAARIYGRRLNKSARAIGLIDRTTSDELDGRLMRLQWELTTGHGERGDLITARRLATTARTPAERARFCWLASETVDTPEEQSFWLGSAIEQDDGYLTATLALEYGSHSNGQSEDYAVALAARGRAAGAPEALVRSGQIVANLGDVGGAIELYTQAMTMASPEQLFGPVGPAEALRRALARAERLSDEVVLIEELLGQDLPRNPRLLLLNRLADLYTRLDRDAEAARAWRAVCEHDPEDQHARNCLAAVLTARGEWDALHAMRTDELASTEDGSGPSRVIQWELAELEARRLNALPEALERVEHACQTAPEDSSLYYLGVRLLEQSGDLAALVSHHKRRLNSLRDSGAITELAIEIGLLEMARGDRDGAQWAFERALRHDKRNLLALDKVLVLDHERRGQRLNALMAAEQDPRYQLSLQFQLARHLETTGSLDQALDLYAALATKPDGDASSLAWQRLCTSLGQREPYSTWLGEAIAVDTDGPHVVELLARRFFLAEASQRRERLQALLQRAPEDLLALVARFREVSTNNQLEAVASTCHSLSTSTHDAAAEAGLLEAAIAFASLLDQPLAEESYWHVLDADPGNIALVIRLMATLRGSNVARQRRIYEAALHAAVQPIHQALFRTSLALALADGDQLEAADGELDKALVDNPKFLPAIKLQRFIAEHRGKYAEVADSAVLEAALVVTPGAAIRCMIHAARLRADHLNDIGGATRLLKQVVAIEPLNEEAFVLLHRIYTTTRAHDELRALLRERADEIRDLDEQKTLYREAADVATAAKDIPAAISDLEACVRLDPSDLSSYDELHRVAAAHERWDKAAQALDGKLEQLRSVEDKVHVLLQLAELLDEKKRDYPRAIAALRTLLNLRPENLAAHHRIANLYEKTRDYADCIRTLEQILELERDIGRRKKAVERMFHGRLNWFDDPKAAERCMLRMRELDVGDLSLVDELAHWLAGRGLRDHRHSMLEHSFNAYRERFLADPSKSDALHALYRISGWLQAPDRSFVIASLLVEQDAANDAERKTWTSGTREMPSLKGKAIRPEKLAVMHAPGLSSSLLEIIRQCDRYLYKVSPVTPLVKGLSRRNRVKPSARAEVAALETHADAFDMDLPTVYVVPEKEDPRYVRGSGKDTVIVLEEEDLSAQNLEATRFHAARACAAEALGAPAFVSLSFDEFMEAILGFAQAVLPQQSFLHAPPADQYSKALPRKLRDSLTPFFLQLAKSLEEATLAIEYQALQLTCMRHAIATMRDPSPAARVIRELHASGTFPIAGAYRDTLQFIVSDEYFQVRKDSGVAFS